LRAEIIGRRAPLDIGVVGDVRATVEALLPRLKEKRDSIHLDQALEHYRKARKGLDESRLAGTASRLYIRSKSPKQSAILLTMMRSSPAMWGCPQSGPSGIWR